uniref:Pentraxin 4 n=1 Tax=Terrapene triunguis TaxID=2587831 RepID=A0A674I6Z2_9SAUR
MLPVCLLLAAVCLQGSLLQEAGTRDQRKPFFERFRRLEEQFRRFQEVTLLRLQGIAGNYNISYNIDTRFRLLAEQYDTVAAALNASHAALREDLGSLKTWMKKLQRRTKKLASKLSSLAESLSESRHTADLTALRASRNTLQKELESLREASRSQGTKLEALEQQLKNTWTIGVTQYGCSYVMFLWRGRGARRLVHRHNARMSSSLMCSGQAVTVAFSLPSPVCNVDSMLLFPSASTENFATFGQGFQTGLHELSVCSWVSTHARSLGTILSYATEENDNKLVLHGRNTAALASIHFVIGDPAFRELPVGQLLDGGWHHMCVIWSSIQGKYWFYVDRRLASTGSKFQEGYEIPPGGSLVLGQEQDVVGGGFDPSEAFVGRLSGFAIWNRTLMPGEVSSIAIGKGLPRGTILRLADVSSLNGSVQKVNCTCLEHCL